MTNMRRGFTMIELIFVIVIIGILAAVAIPKLTATRDDAKISKTVANLRTVIEDAKNYYTANGDDATANPTTAWGAVTWARVTDTVNKTTEGAKSTADGTSLNIDGEANVPCFTVTPNTVVEVRNGRNVNVRVVQIAAVGAGTRICDAAHPIADDKGLIAGAGPTNHILGGRGVNF